MFVEWCSESGKNEEKTDERKNSTGERGDDMQQGHKLDSSPQHLEYMPAGWEITTSHQPNSGNLWLRLVSLSTGPAGFGRYHLEFESVFGCQSEERKQVKIRIC